MKTLIKSALACTLLTGLLSTTAFAQTTIKGGKIITNTVTGTLPNSTLVIDKNGVVSTLLVSDKKHGDKSDNYWITPGFFAPYSTLGLVEVSAVRGTNNTSADKTEASVSLRAADSINPHSTSIPVSRLGGVLFAAVAPGSNIDIFGGIGSVISTSGSFSSILDDEAFIFIAFDGGSERTGRNRGAAMAYLRAALDDAQNFNTRFSGPTDGDALRRADAKALRVALQGQKPLLVAADRAIDIHNIISLKSQHPSLKISIFGGAEAWMVADELATANIAVIIDPLEDLPYNFDLLGARLDNAKTLIDAGVNTAFMARTATGGSAHNLRLIAQHAGNAVANGVSWDDAFKAVSLVPATIYGHSELAQIRSGEKANLVVWDGDPLEITSAPIAIYIDGELQPLTSRQTELSTRYNPLRDTTKPYGYPQP